jgi:hypothetical protein
MNIRQASISSASPVGVILWQSHSYHAWVQIFTLVLFRRRMIKRKMKTHSWTAGTGHTPQ